MDTPEFGQVTAGVLTAVQLSALSGAPGEAAAGGILLKARSTNTGVIYIGHDNTVTANTGFELLPGDALPVAIQNDEKLWLIQTVAADRLCWGTVRG